MKKLLVNASAALATTFALSPLVAFAQGDLFNPSDPGDYSPETVKSTFTDVLSTILDWALVIAGFLAIIYLIWAGIQYITGGAEAAKKQIINSVIGIIVIVLAYVIVRAAIALVGG